ncbi:MAG TPA: ADOP family duplicated permease [Acidobacteriota bacterium]|nr:ADOP family duplicated permease [Acidobacteriota bacterium]
MRMGISILHDLTRTVRRLVRRPLFLLTATVMLAFGIGANGLMFGIVDRTLLRPPMHIENAQRVRLLYLHQRFLSGQVSDDNFSYLDYQRLQDCSAFDSIAAVATQSPILGHGPEARQIQSQAVSGSFFRLLGVEPRLGRFIDDEDDRPEAPIVAILGHGFWRDRFGASQDVLGRRLEIGDLSATVIGVAPQGFSGIDLAPVDLWLPLRSSADGLGHSVLLDDEGSWWLQIVVRLKTGVSLPAANQEATSIVRKLSQEMRPDHDPEARVTSESLIAAEAPGAPPETQVARWLSGVSLAVLLIACANVANLLLIRAVQQRQEIVLQLSLGMPRAQLVARQLAVGLMLALLGSAAALAMVYWGGALVRSTLFPAVDWSNGIVTLRLAFFTLVLLLLAGLASTIIPVWQTRRADLTQHLRSGRTTMTSRSRLLTFLLLGQIVLSVVLLVGASLFVQSLRRAESLDLGFDDERVLVLRPSVQAGVKEADIGVLYEQALGRLRALQGVESATAAYTVPFQGSIALPLRVPGADPAAHTGAGRPFAVAVTGDYFRTLGIEIIKGRPLGDRDRSGSAPAAVVGKTMAAMLWPGQDPLGKCLLIGKQEQCTTVVGVAEDARRQDLVEDGTLQYYIPTHVLGRRPQFLLVKVSPQGASSSLLRNELHALDGRFRYVRIEALSDVVAPRKRTWRVGATLFSIYGAVALLMAAMGLYSSLAFEVAHRKQELGIRAAIGATPPRLIRHVLVRSLRLTTVGLATGLALAALTAPAMRDQLFRTSPHHAGSYLTVALLLLVVALIAGLQPSLRASRVDPNQMLRVK